MFLKFITPFLLFISCNNDQIKDNDFYVINSVFNDLIENNIFDETYIEYKKRTGYDVNDFSSFEELYELYNKEKEELKIRNVYIYDRLKPIKDSIYDDIIELKSPWHNDLKEYIDLHKSELKFNPEEDIHLPERFKLAPIEISDYYFSFSRVHFNENKEKAFFLYEIGCLKEDCYSLSIVFVEMKNGKWDLSKVRLLAVS